VHRSKSGPLMSAVGQNARTRIEHILSALPPLATEERTFRIGSSVPQAVIDQPLLDHLVRSQHQTGRDLVADCLRGLEVDH
jgi:hypothetical protein